MNNEIGRKITSLTLMTIMLAGGMVVAAPSMVPEAAAVNASLFVSAENAEFGNTFAGGQIVEIIVSDTNLSDTEVVEAEPTVEVNDDTVRMTQGADGNWYAYVANTAGVVALDAVTGFDYGTALTLGTALGTTATATVDATIGGDADAIDAVEIVITSGGSNYETAPVVTFTQGACADLPTGTANLTNGVVTSVTITGDGGSTCTGTETLTFAAPTTITTSDNATVYFNAAVIGGEPTLSSTGNGQIGVASWPFIQTFDFSSEDVEIIYEKAGTDESVLLDYTSMEDFASIAMDRNSAPPGAEVHFTITDYQLNIDPTSQETITFDTVDGTASYGANTDNSMNTGNSCDTNCTLKVTYNTNGSAVIDEDTTDDDTSADIYWVFTESASNSGVWSNTDDNDDSSINILAGATRGTTATIDYNDSAQSLVVAYSTGIIDLDESTVGDEWNSGESMTVTLTDADLNLNTLADNDLTIAGSTAIPTIVIGSPVSLTTANDSRILEITTDGDGLYTTVITGADVNAIDSTLDQANVDVSACTGATGFTLTGTAGGDADQTIATSTSTSATVDLTEMPDDGVTAIVLDVDGAAAVTCNVVVDFFSFGAGTHNAVYRILLEETDENTGIFAGTVEYTMLNQLNSDVLADIPDVTAIDSDVTIVLAADRTGTDAPRVKYTDTDSDGQSTSIADQADANTHSGVVSFDTGNYKIADTVNVTVEDMDLNLDSELIDVYVSDAQNVVGDNTAADEAALLHVLDIKIGGSNVDLDGLGFNLVETDTASGVFVGSFQVPSSASPGSDLEVNYVDFLDASGNKIEVGDSASIKANTGVISLDRSVYPVPYGSVTNMQFLEHGTATGTDDLAQGDVTVWITVSDADYDTSATGEDTITDTEVTVKVKRGSDSYTVATLADSTADALIETSPSSGVFEISQTITYQQGPDTNCPSVFTDQGDYMCVLQGDIITVEYADLKDASGEAQTVTDSATFDLRNGVIQSDKSVYLIGSDMILTLIEPDFDLDSDSSESYTLDLIEWDSDAATATMGSNSATSGSYTAFDPEPSDFRETGDNTGIFQVVVNIPDTLDSNLLDRGEKIDLEFTDWGPAGSNYVGQENEDIGLTIYTSNFGATIELDQKVYTWTDKVYITIVAPDHNFDSDLVDEVGNTSSDPVKIATRGNDLSTYKLVESGADTGIFIGEVILSGMIHDADGDGTDDITGSQASRTSGTGPTDGQLAAKNNDGLTVSFEFSEDQTVVSSALIRWNIGEVQWLEASYPASGTGVVRIIDADMNLNPEAVDNFEVDAWSDSDAGGISLTVTETNEATGIFEGTVFFTVTNDSSGHRLRVSEGDTVTAEYEDNTLPEPYTTADELDITSTTLIGTVVPPLERAPAANLRTVDAFGNNLDVVSIDQQVQLTADLSNGVDKEQSFAYLVQIQDGDGVTVSLAWITGSLTSGQSFSPALSWIPTEAGSYTATAFVWESVDNPTALAPTVSTTITVQ